MKCFYCISLSVCSDSYKNNKQRTMTSIQRRSSSSSSTLSSSTTWTYTRGLKYLDGSMYKGLLDRYGRRFGSGTMRKPLYNAYDPANTSALVQWTEYCGEWRNNLPNGYGVVRKYRGDGTCITVYEGEWINGQPALE